MKPEKVSFPLISALLFGIGAASFMIILKVEMLSASYYEPPNSGLLYGIFLVFFDFLGSFTSIPGLTVCIYTAIGFGIGVLIQPNRSVSQVPFGLIVIFLLTLVAVAAQFAVPNILYSENFCDKARGRQSACFHDLADFRQDARFCQKADHMFSCVESAGSFRGYTEEKCNIISLRSMRAYCKTRTLVSSGNMTIISCLQSNNLESFCDKYVIGSVDSHHFVITPDEIIECQNSKNEKCSEAYLKQKEESQ